MRCSTPPPSPRRRERARGVVLAETVMALGIVVVAILALLGALLAMQLDAEVARERLTATTAARRKLEEIAAAPFGAVRTQDGATATTEPLAPQRGRQETLRVAVAPTANPDGTPNQDLLRATVTVAWRGLRGDDSLSLTVLTASRK